MNNIVTFNNQNIELIRHNGQLYLTSKQIAEVLEYRSSTSITNLYNEHKTEFDSEMTEVIDSMISGNYKSKARIFNREGAWLIGMFARTPKAAEFRRWVLKVLGNTVDNVYPCGEVNVREHTRSLPSGRKEIVLSEKAKAEIGGIVKNCLAAALEAKRPEMSGSSPNMTIEKSSPNMTKGILGSSPRMTEEISPRMTTEIDYQKLAAGVGGWVSMTLMSARYDDLRLEAESLRKRAALCEKQAEEVMKSVKKIESAFGI